MLSEKIVHNLKKSSGIRAMFEEGERLRKIYGSDQVYDFTLGNPDPEPPESVRESILRLVRAGEKGLHKYMSNAGFADVREKIASSQRAETGYKVEAHHVLMTVGAAGALNVLLKSLLNTGEEVIVFSPYFVEYGFYAENHGGRIVVAQTRKEDFQPDAGSLEKTITKKTKAILLNTPNNPTGAVYTREVLKQLRDVICKKEQQLGIRICVISDEPYTRLVYDGVEVPCMFDYFINCVRVTSFSKSLSLPGERIGYAVLHPEMEEGALLMDAMVFCNRVLGYVNAPALFQKVIAENLDAKVDVDVYRERRDLLYGKLTSLGFRCVKPEGAFYLFPECPVDDDVRFKQMALENRILLVPGGGFGQPGYFRLAYCVDKSMIQRSFPAFEKLADQAGL
ncbi:MAG TPA: pyridoxal phosphate-dependent aminotransferase [Clostridiales bacterium]|nr:pyridoxal phosphate-dependent aminotransferase [Clostridiales bacterium]